MHIQSHIKSHLRSHVRSHFPSDDVDTFTFEVITAGADTFQLPLEATGTYDFHVDWGDSSSSDITVWNHTDTNHSYAGAGTYNVVVTGTLTGWAFADAGDKTLINDISSWGPLRLGNSTGYFYGCANLTVSATDILDLTGTTDFGAGFRNCSSLTDIPSICLWDFSSVTSLNGMFRSTIVDQDLGDIGISSVTSMNAFLTDVTMSTVNWSNTLIGFEAQTHQDTVTISGGNSKHNAGGATAITALEGDTWTITDGGLE